MTERFPVLAAVVTALILVAVLLPGSAIPRLPDEWPGVDKLAHLLMFLAWATALHADFGLVSARRVVAAFAACVAFSLLTEVLQLFVEGRAFDPMDGLADLAGFSAGVLARKTLARPLAKLARKRTNAIFS